MEVFNISWGFLCIVCIFALQIQYTLSDRHYLKSHNPRTLSLGNDNLDCCTPAYTPIESGCAGQTVKYQNQTYNCYQVRSNCPSCLVDRSVNSSSCSHCCLASSYECSSSDASDVSTFLMLMTLCAIAFLFCTLICLSAEQLRLKEGITFQEAYLLPIPLVTAETNLEGRNIRFPPDQPTAIARVHTSIDVAIAEPAEISPLLIRPAEDHQD